VCWRLQRVHFGVRTDGLWQDVHDARAKGWPRSEREVRLWIGRVDILVPVQDMTESLINIIIIADNVYGAVIMT